MHSVKFKSERKSGNRNCKITTQQMKNFYVCNLWCLVKKKKEEKNLPSLSINSCRALKEPDCRGWFGSSSWSFCNIRYTSDSSILVRVLGLSTHTRHSTLIVIYIYIYIYAVFMYKEQDDNPEEICFFSVLASDATDVQTDWRVSHLSGLGWTKPLIWPSMASWMLSEE